MQQPYSQVDAEDAEDGLTILVSPSQPGDDAEGVAAVDDDPLDGGRPTTAAGEGGSVEKKKKRAARLERVLPQAMFKKLYEELLEFKQQRRQPQEDLLTQRAVDAATAEGSTTGKDAEGEEGAVVAAPAVPLSGWGPLPKTEFIGALLDLCCRAKEKLVRPMSMGELDE